MSVDIIVSRLRTEIRSKYKGDELKLFLSLLNERDKRDCYCWFFNTTCTKDDYQDLINELDHAFKLPYFQINAYEFPDKTGYQIFESK